MAYPGQRARKAGGQKNKVAPNPDFEPLLQSGHHDLGQNPLHHRSRAPVRSSPTVPRRDVGAAVGFGRDRSQMLSSTSSSFRTYDALSPMPVSRSISPNSRQIHRSSIDGSDEEATPLLSSENLLGEDSAFLLEKSPSDRHHMAHQGNPPRQSGPSRRPLHTRHAARALPRTKSPRLAIAHNENPAKDLAGLCSYGCCCVQCVRTKEVGILQKFGQFQRLLDPGLYCIMWPCTRIPGKLSLRVQQLDVMCETKTKDNVFVYVSVAVQYRVLLDKCYDAFYRLTDPRIQINAYVFDVVRSHVPRMYIDDVFANKSDLATDVLRRLQVVMNQYGYEILEALVTNISPNQHVKDSMNEINASKRLKEAMAHKAEAEKVKKIKAAEAEAETHYLRGTGIARERQAIAKGLKETIANFSLGDINEKDVMDVLVISHYFDTLVTVGANNLILSHDPDQVVELQNQLSSYFVTDPHKEAAEAGLEGIDDLLL